MLAYEHAALAEADAGGFLRCNINTFYVWTQMLMPKKNRIAIYELLFKEGVMVAKKDVHLAKHPELADKNVPNLHVMKAMQVRLRSVTHIYYWTVEAKQYTDLTEGGYHHNIEFVCFLGTFLFPVFSGKTVKCFLCNGDKDHDIKRIMQCSSYEHESWLWPAVLRVLTAIIACWCFIV